MNTSRCSLAVIGMLLTLVALAAFAFGALPPDAIGATLLMASAPIGFPEIKELIDAQGAAMDTWRKKHDERLSELERDVKQQVLKNQRPGTGTDDDRSTKGNDTEHWIDTKSGDRVAVLGPRARLADLEQKQEGELPSLGRVLRGIVLGDEARDAKALADERKALNIGTGTAGGFNVQGALAAEWIDRLRAAMVLQRAGVRTVPMDANTLTIASITGDPTVSWHGENKDLPESEPSLGAVTLRSQTCTSLVKMSLELAQDASNIEDIVTSVLTNSMAQAIDAAGLVGVTADAGAAPQMGGIFNLANRNRVTSVGAPTSWDFVLDAMYELMLDNVPADRIGGLVAHPALWKKMRKLKTGLASDNTPLTMPEEVARLPKYWTTAAPFTSGTTAQAVLGDWGDMLMGVRKSIQVQVLREAFMGSKLQVGVLAYARVDFVATRAESFCTAEGITVA